jgi:hypothetical protein
MSDPLQDAYARLFPSLTDDTAGTGKLTIKNKEIECLTQGDQALTHPGLAHIVSTDNEAKSAPADDTESCGNPGASKEFDPLSAVSSVNGDKFQDELDERIAFIIEGEPALRNQYEKYLPERMALAELLIASAYRPLRPWGDLLAEHLEGFYSDLRKFTDAGLLSNA